MRKLREGNDAPKASYDLLYVQANNIARSCPAGINDRKDGICLLDHQDRNSSPIQQIGDIYYALARHNTAVDGLYPVDPAAVTRLVADGKKVQLCREIRTGCVYLAPEAHVDLKSFNTQRYLREEDFRTLNKPYLKIQYVVHDGVKVVKNIVCGHSSNGVGKSVKDLLVNPNQDSIAFNQWDRPGNPFSTPYKISQLADFSVKFLSTANKLPFTVRAPSGDHQLQAIMRDLDVKETPDGGNERVKNMIAHAQRGARVELRDVLDRSAMDQMNKAAIKAARESAMQKSPADTLRRRLFENAPYEHVGRPSESIVADRLRKTREISFSEHMAPFTFEQIESLVNPKDWEFAFAFAAGPALRTYFDGKNWHVLVCGVNSHPCTLGAKKTKVTQWLETWNDQIAEKGGSCSVRIATAVEAFSSGYSDRKKEGWTSDGFLSGMAHYDIKKDQNPDFFALDVGTYLTVDITLDSAKLRGLGWRARWNLWRAEERKKQ